MIRSHSLVANDFQSDWYKRWAKELKQSKGYLENHSLYANKFWQNAIMVQALWERGAFGEGKRGIGFGVGQERLPALFAKYGTFITATDQDFKTQKAGHWSKHELATGAQSLNKLRISNPKQFANLVEYQPIDMTEIPAKFAGSYDFLWSNCALGHLGSIPDGLEFIEKSLRCLQPGGWAVHTTELNILSNSTTVTGGTTVIFRLQDIYQLQRRLLAAGYSVSPFHLEFGRTARDSRVTMRPEFGNDFSKIQVMGHLATQIVLIIHKPTQQPSAAMRWRQAVAIRRAYLRNLATMRRYKTTDKTARALLKSEHTKPNSLKIIPVRSKLSVELKNARQVEIFVEYDNQSTVPLFSTYSRLAEAKPITLATTDPGDRPSAFATSSWPGENRNRVTTDLWVKAKKGDYKLANYIQPGERFAFRAKFKAPLGLKPGSHKERFSIVQEMAGWIPNSDVTITFKN
jgi:hypothetical protein